MRLYIAAISLMLLVSCKNDSQPSRSATGFIHYINNPSISDRLGNPKDSLTVYLPPEKLMDTITWYWWYDQPTTKKRKAANTIKTRADLDKLWDEFRVAILRHTSKTNISKYHNVSVDSINEVVEIRVDSFYLNWFSYYLYSFQEPVLHNYDLKKTVYRLTFIPSFNLPFVSSITRNLDSFYLTLKAPDHPFEVPVVENHYIDESGNDIILPFTPKPNPIVINEKHSVSPQVWNRLDSLVKLPDFRKMTSLSKKQSEFMHEPIVLFEAHTPEGYQCIARPGFSNEPIFKAIIGVFFEATDIQIKEQAYFRTKYNP